MKITDEGREVSTIHFGKFGNGITAYDVARERNNDYLTVAHISEEGIVHYYDGVYVSDADRALIEKQAQQQKEAFADYWNLEPIYRRYERVYDAFLALRSDTPEYQAAKNDFLGKNNMSMEEKAAKYEHSLIFQDEPFPFPDVDKDIPSKRSVPKYSVVTFSRYCGTDEKLEYSSLTEAKKAAKAYVTGKAYPVECGFEAGTHDDLAVVYNNRTKMIAHVEGNEYMLGDVFTPEIAKLNLESNPKFVEKYPEAASSLEFEILRENVKAVKEQKSEETPTKEPLPESWFERHRVLSPKQLKQIEKDNDDELSL